MNISISITRNTTIYNILRTLNSYDNNGFLIINLSFSCTGFVSASIYMILTAFINEKKALGHDVTVILDNKDNCDQLNYASRSDFFKAIDVDYNEYFTRRSTKGNLIPITNIPVGAYDLPNDIYSVFKNDFNINDEDVKSIEFIVEEMICNTTIHSKSKSGAFYYFQKYPQRRELEFILIDNGCGIQNSLSKNPKYSDLTNSEAIEKAFEYEVTCGEGRGHGLYIMQEIIKKIGGSITLISNKNAIFINEKGKSISEIEKWDGVYLKIIFKFGSDFTLKSIFNDIGYSA